MKWNDTYIYYSDGYKYQIKKDYRTRVHIYPKENIIADFVELYTDGRFLIKKGFACDGPSGPTVDTPTFMRGAIVHDALYWLIRHGYLSQDLRKVADLILYKICLEDGMWETRVDYVYHAVEMFGESAADPKNIKEVYKAP